jgi:hypothetical protein
MLQAALERAQAGDVCAQQGCRLQQATDTRQFGQPGDSGVDVAPWRDAEWEHPAVRVLRARVSAQADELDRLRQENGLLRRWIAKRVDTDEPERPGV